MTRSKRVFLMAIVLVLCAGVVVGRLSARLAPLRMQQPQHEHQPSWLSDQLNLSAEQRQQMDAIWADTKTQLDKSWDKRRELDRDRDEAIDNLLTPSQLAEYKEIYDEYHAKRQQADKQRDDLIKSAEDRSRALLSDAQKMKWDTLNKQMHDHHGGPHGAPHDAIDGVPTTQGSGQGWHGMHGEHGPDRGPGGPHPNEPTGTLRSPTTVPS
ncbi:MAG: periplasmic heavy metal sensor [Phycisphaerae bacterium]|nr:periplasmic heavy metal sensor [Phycisphaerae bacterium]